MSGRHRAVVEFATASAVAAAWPYFGRGRDYSRVIDTAASGALVRALEGLALGPLELISCEGPRDGTEIVDLPTRASDGALKVYCDPVDGSLNAARGGPRAFSVLALSETFGARDRSFDDVQAIFSIGSRSFDVSSALDDDIGWAELIADSLGRVDTVTATLNRADNLALLDGLSPTGPLRWRTGSRTGYRPTLAAARCIAVGDATITLPFESDVMIGRIGLAEAQIESALYRSWVGLAVSRDRILAWPGGSIEYVTEYLRARRSGDEKRMARLFTPIEVAAFTRRGVHVSSLMETLTPETFGPGLGSAIGIAALSSPQDPYLGVSSGVLESPASHGTWIGVDVMTSVAGEVGQRQVSVSLDLAPRDSKVRMGRRA